MIAEINKYPTHYAFLGLLLSFGVVAILILRFSPPAQTAAVYSLGGLYVVWGIFHHSSIGHLRFKVVLEYLLIALLGVVIITTLI